MERKHIYVCLCLITHMERCRENSGTDSNISHPHFPQPLITSNIPDAVWFRVSVGVMGPIFAFSSSWHTTQHIRTSFSHSHFFLKSTKTKKKIQMNHQIPFSFHRIFSFRWSETEIYHFTEHTVIKFKPMARDTCYPHEHSVDTYITVKGAYRYQAKCRPYPIVSDQLHLTSKETASKISVNCNIWKIYQVF